MAAAARLCRLLPTGRKNVVASLVVRFRLHVRQAQVVSVGVPLTIYRRIQLTQNSQVNDEAVAQVLGNAVDEHLRSQFCLARVDGRTLARVLRYLIERLCAVAQHATVESGHLLSVNLADIFAFLIFNFKFAIFVIFF